MIRRADCCGSSVVPQPCIQIESQNATRYWPALALVLASVGLPHDHSLVHTEEVAIVDAWLGDPR